MFSTSDHIKDQNLTKTANGEKMTLSWRLCSVPLIEKRCMHENHAQIQHAMQWSSQYEAYVDQLSAAAASTCMYLII